MLSGKTAVVTGASKGIGRAIAVALGEHGAHVVVNYNGSEQAAKETVQAITEKGGSAEAMKFNVADYTETSEAITEIIQKHGKLDILVNNAGITKDGLMMRMSEEDFDAVINTNLKGAFTTCKADSIFVYSTVPYYFIGKVWISKRHTTKQETICHTFFHRAGSI